MDLKKIYDFYVDIDGDIKATVNGQNMVCEHINNHEKFSSHYFVAKEFNTIKELVYDINPDFHIDFGLFSQYAIKYDKNKNRRGVKIYADCNDMHDNIVMVLLGYEIYPERVLKDYYFIGDVDAVEEYIKKNKISYTIQKFDTHKPILFSIKMDGREVVDFKTYYVLNNMVRIYKPLFLEKSKLFFQLEDSSGCNIDN